MPRVKANLYRLESCGYYKRNEELPSFGGMHEVFCDFQAWINDMSPTVRETQTFTCTPDSSNLPAYCYDIQSNKDGDYLMTVWNETPTLGGQFASVQGDVQVGKAKVETLDKPEENIAGYPTYFYIIPSAGLVCSIRFDGSITGIRNFNKYMRGYLERFSNWVVLEDAKTNSLEARIVGYRNSNDSVASKAYFVRFLAKPSRKLGDIEKIKARRTSIRKIIRKDRYEVSKKEKKKFMTGFLSLMGIQNINSVSQMAEYKVELEFISPSVEELDEIINSWDVETDHSSWDDVGFCLKGDSQTYWLGSMMKKEELDIEMPLVQDGVAVASSLLEKISLKKDILINKFNE